MNAVATYLPLIVAVVSLIVAALKHFDHAALAGLLEEAITLEREREGGTPTVTLLREAAESKGLHDALDAVLDRVSASQAAKAVALPTLTSNEPAKGPPAS